MLSTLYEDAGQIHFVESGIAAIPEVDEIHYVCNRCGKEFEYAPALSRDDNNLISSNPTNG